MAHKFGSLLLLQFLLLGSSSEGRELPEVMDELNKHLGFATNIIYNPELKQLDYLQKIQPVNQLIISSVKESSLNGSELMQFINNKVLFVLLVNHPPLDFLQKLYPHFENADFLLVIEQGDLDGTWLRFVYDAWQLGHTKLLFLNAEILYEKRLFPEVRFDPSSVQHYAATRGRFSNLHGHKIRVAVYSNPPRSLLYMDKWGKQHYGGYYLRFIRHFIKSKNATFVPILAPNYSVGQCKKDLLSNRVDVCADALAHETIKKFAVTIPRRVAFANIIVPNAKPLGSYRYLMAPFHSTVWICLIIYIGFIVCFMSCIHWQRDRRWFFSKFLLEAISSLLFSGFALKDLRGRERYILFMVLFIAGFIYSTFYLGYLKSILATEVLEKQINSFEQLVEANISLIIDEYDRNLTLRYHMPEILWQIMKMVPDETLKSHLNSFDQNYAYILFNDRIDLYEHAQKYLKHPHLRNIPIKIMLLFAGFPMRQTWFLKNHLSDAWANSVDSGLWKKLTLDANSETMTSSMGFLEFRRTEYYEAQPLGLDYFVMPAMSLGLGYGLAFVTFVIELIAWRTDCTSLGVD